MPRHVRKGGGGLNSPQLKKNAHYMHPLLIEILVDVVSITLSLTVHLHLILLISVSIVLNIARVSLSYFDKCATPHLLLQKRKNNNTLINRKVADMERPAQ